MARDTRALLLDLDGVLVLSQAAQDRNWRSWCAEHGLSPVPFLAAHGLTGAEKIRRFAPMLDPIREARRITAREVCDTAGVIAAPGAETICQIAAQWAVVTSAAHPLAVARLRAAGLAMPDHIVTAESVVRSKPDSEPFLAGAALLGVHPADCTVFEDAPAGVQGAIAAGMRVVGISTTVPADALSAATVVVPSLLDAIAWWLADART